MRGRRGRRGGTTCLFDIRCATNVLSRTCNYESLASLQHPEWRAKPSQCKAHTKTLFYFGLSNTSPELKVALWWGFSVFFFKTPSLLLPSLQPWRKHLHESHISQRQITSNHGSVMEEMTVDEGAPLFHTSYSSCSPPPNSTATALPVCLCCEHSNPASGDKVIRTGNNERERKS